MKRILWCGIILLTVILDQVSKYLTVLYLKPIADLPLIEGWLHLTYVENRGAAFGMLQNHRIFFLVFSTVGIALLLALLLVKGRELSAFGSVAVCLIIGGGIGNQIDRLVQGYVVDMIYVKIIDFAVFNLADSFVCVGVGIALICALTVDSHLLEEIEAKKKPRQTETPLPEAPETAEEDETPKPEAGEEPHDRSE